MTNDIQTTLAQAQRKANRTGKPVWVDFGNGKGKRIFPDWKHAPIRGLPFQKRTLSK